MAMNTFNLILISMFAGFLLIILGITMLLFTRQYKKLKLSKLSPQRRRFLKFSGLAVIGVAIGGVAIDRFIKSQPYNGPVIICNGWIIKEEELRPNVCEPTTIR